MISACDTFTGLSGLSDLPCFSRDSRNRGFGERVGRREKPPKDQQETAAVIAINRD